MKKIIILQFLLNSFFTLFIFANLLVFPTHVSAQVVYCTGYDPYSFAPTPPGCTPTPTTTPTPTPRSNLNINIENPLTSDTLQGVVDNILQGITAVLTPVIAVMFLWTGFLFVKAQGNGEELIKAREALMYTIIGAAIVLGAHALSLVISQTVSQL